NSTFQIPNSEPPPYTPFSLQPDLQPFPPINHLRTPWILKEPLIRVTSTPAYGALRARARALAIFPSTPHFTPSRYLFIQNFPFLIHNSRHRAQNSKLRTSQILSPQAL